jgi:hypothetical protein
MFVANEFVQRISPDAVLDSNLQTPTPTIVKQPLVESSSIPTLNFNRTFVFESPPSIRKHEVQFYPHHGDCHPRLGPKSAKYS